MDSRVRAIEIIDYQVAEILRRNTPAERLAIADGIWRSAREMIRDVTTKTNISFSISPSAENGAGRRVFMTPSSPSAMKSITFGSIRSQS
jgi:hypothetical protein